MRVPQLTAGQFLHFSQSTEDRPGPEDGLIQTTDMGHGPRSLLHFNINNILVTAVIFSCPASGFNHPQPQHIFLTTHIPIMPRTQPKKSPQVIPEGVDYVYCSKCGKTFDPLAIRHAHAHIARAASSKIIGSQVCVGAKVMFHFVKPSNKAAVGGTARSKPAEDANNQAPALASVDPGKSSLSSRCVTSVPVIPMEEYADHYMPDDMDDVEHSSSPRQGGHHDTAAGHVPGSLAWTSADMDKCMIEMRSFRNGSQTMQRLVHNDDIIHRYSEAQCSKWTDADIIALRSMSDDAHVRCFTADGERELAALRDKTQISQTQQIVMQYCTENHLTSSASNGLVKMLQNPALNLADMTGTTFNTMQNHIKDNLPEQYAFKDIPLYVGKLYCEPIPVTDKNQKVVTVAVRNFFDALMCLYPDSRYKGHMELCPKPIFNKGPDGRLEREFSGWATCECTGVDCRIVTSNPLTA